MFFDQILEKWNDTKTFLKRAIFSTQFQPHVQFSKFLLCCTKVEVAISTKLSILTDSFWGNFVPTNHTIRTDFYSYSRCWCSMITPMSLNKLLQFPHTGEGEGPHNDCADEQSQRRESEKEPEVQVGLKKKEGTRSRSSSTSSEEYIIILPDCFDTSRPLGESMYRSVGLFKKGICNCRKSYLVSILFKLAVS